MERMQATRAKKASSAQLTTLAEHMQAHPALAAGISNNLQGRLHLESLWKSLAAKLNSMGGPIKTVVKWKQTWRDMRNNVKKKASHNANEHRGYGPNSTGHGPSTLNEFSQVDEQVLSVMGPVAVYGLEDVACTEPSYNPIEETAGEPVPELVVQPELVVEPELVLVPEPVIQRAHPPKRKRRRVAPQIDSFDEKLLLIEEQKLQNERERNTILREKNEILNSWTGPRCLQSESIINYHNQGVGAMEFNDKFHRARLVGALEDISKKMNK